MQIITTTADLTDFCNRLTGHKYITIDTEFIREKTYYAQLCLIQVASIEEAVIIDPLAKSIDLSPFYDVLKNKNILKVFHAAKQDLEIFYVATGFVPTPLFDSQIHAMVLGFGDQVGYETLVNKVLNISIDKMARFTDWSKRPLSQKQLEYAVSDVTHLRDIYETFTKQINEQNRTHWIDDEIEKLQDENTYAIKPEEAYKRLKYRNTKPKFLAVLREVTALREKGAINRNIPRRRFIKDETLLDIASSCPTSPKQLKNIRGIPNGWDNSDNGKKIISAINAALKMASNNYPVVEKYISLTEGQNAVADLMHALLKDCADSVKVAPRIIASASDIESIVRDQNSSPVLKSWRYELFGERALRLKDGKIALAVKDNKLTFIDLD